jgi:hypothetical protein
MSEQKPRKPLTGYFRNPSNGQAVHRPRKPIGSHFRQPEPAPASLEDTQPDIPEQDKPDVFLKQQDTPPASERQQDPQEPDRYQPSAGYSRLGRVLQTGDYVDVTQAARLRGLYIIGIQGYGKSGLEENLIIQDIKQQIGVCVLDPHGELIEHVIARLPDKEKEEKVILLDLKNKVDYIGLNLFDCADPTDDDEITKTLDLVKHVFDKAFGITQANPLMYNLLYKIAYVLIANPGYTMVDMPLFLTNEAFRKKLVHNVTDYNIRTFWETWDNPKRKSPRDQEADSQTILNKLNDFSHAPLRYIVGQSSSTIDLQKIMDEGKILLVKLDRRRETATALIGSILVALILNASDARLTKKQFNLYADEFQRFATEDFATLLEEARKSGIGITMAHQNRSQLSAKSNELETDLKDRTRSTDNLVVFRINRKDADDLAGEFAEEPEEASQAVLVPQRHERIEEQVEVEVEKEIQEISQTPVDHLVRGSHGRVSVRKATQAMLAPLVEAAEGRTGAIPIISKGREECFPSPLNERMITYNCSYYLPREVQGGKTLVNRLLVDVMEKRVAVEYPCSELTTRIQEIMLTLSGYIGWFGVYEHVSDSYYHIGWNVQHQPDKTLYHSLASLIQRIVDNENVVPSYSAFCFELKRCVSQVFKPENETYNMTQYQNSISEWADQAGRCARDFISNLITLCKGLAADPILVGTGQKRMVKRIQPHITYIPHESEKIQHPRRAEQDMVNEMARTLTNLPLYTARAKITIKTGPDEYTIKTLEMKTLDPKKHPDKPLYGQALQERIDSIRDQNREGGYVRPRHEVEEEIRTRQEQYNKPPQEPPISPQPPREQPRKQGVVPPPEDEPPVTRRKRN